MISFISLPPVGIDFSYLQNNYTTLQVICKADNSVFFYKKKTREKIDFSKT